MENPRTGLETLWDSVTEQRRNRQLMDGGGWARLLRRGLRGLMDIPPKRHLVEFSSDTDLL